jgi:hypothetical protein
MSDIDQSEQNSRDAEIHLTVQRFVELCKGNDSRTLAREELAKLNPNHFTYDAWQSIGRGLHRVFGGSDVGFLEWVKWSGQDIERFQGEIQMGRQWRSFGAAKDDVYQEQREAGDRTTEYLKKLEVGGFKLSDVIDFGIAHLYATNPASKIPEDMAERFYGSIAIEVGKTLGYWYRRTEIAETALEPFDKLHRLLDVNDMDPAELEPEELRSSCAHAHAVLAERRKYPEKNLEEDARDRRQTKFFNFAKRTWGDIAASLEQRATRGLEEQLELVDAIRVKYILESDSGPDHSTASVTPKGRKDYLKQLCKDLIKHVVRNPAGDVAQELGGVAVTTMATAEALGLSVVTCEKDEFARVLAKPRKELQARHDAKPR